MTFSRFLRDNLSEANPVAAGMQVDFEERDADRSRYTIGHNIHPASELEDEQMAAGGEGMQAPYDGAMVPGGPGGGMPGEMPPGGGAPTDQELQPIQPGMAPPGGQGMPPQQPLMQGYTMKDEFDLLLDHILSEAPFDTYGPDPGGGRGGYAAPGGGYPNYPAATPTGYGGYPGYGQPAYRGGDRPVGYGEYRGSTANLNNQEYARQNAAQYQGRPQNAPASVDPAYWQQGMSDVAAGNAGRGGGGGGGGRRAGGGGGGGAAPKVGNYREAGKDEDLGLGHKGARVKELQQELIKNGAKIEADGMYGPQTKAAHDAQKASAAATGGNSFSSNLTTGLVAQGQAPAFPRLPTTWGTPNFSADSMGSLGRAIKSWTNPTPATTAPAPAATTTPGVGNAAATGFAKGAVPPAAGAAAPAAGAATAPAAPVGSPPGTPAGKVQTTNPNVDARTSGNQTPPPPTGAPAQQQAAPAQQPSSGEQSLKAAGPAGGLTMSMTWDEHNKLFEADMRTRQLKAQNL